MKPYRLAIPVTLCAVLTLCLLQLGCTPKTSHPTENNHTTDSSTATPADSTTPTGADPSKPQRSFKLGVVPIPAGWSSEQIAAAYRRSKEAGEVVSLTQKLGWGSNEHAARYEDDVTLARKYGLELFISIDVLEDDRHNIGNLPAELKGKTFADQTLRRHYTKEVTAIARKYRPANLALAVEINGYYSSHRDDFPNFVSLYKDTFRSVKAVSPKTKIAVSFQYETMVAENQWNLLSLFGEQLETLCLTTYPEFLYGDSPDDVPDTHYAILKNIEGLPIVFTEIGWSGKPGSESERRQADFIRRFFALTKDTPMSLAIWSLLHDWQGGGKFETMGLIDPTGKPKLAWKAFREL